MYLEDIENRVSRIQPRLEQIAPRRYVSPEYFEGLEALEAQRLLDAKPPVATPAAEATLAPEPSLVAEFAPSTETALASESTPVVESLVGPEAALAPEPALEPESSLAPEPAIATASVLEPELALESAPALAPVALAPEPVLTPESTLAPEAIIPTPPELALAVATPLPLVIPQQEATAFDLPVFEAVPSPAIDAARLRRLRIVNAVLTLLLIVVCGSAAIFGYQYLHPQSGFFANIVHRFSAPLEKQSVKPSPVEQAITAPNPDAAPSAASPSRTNQSPDARDTHPPATPAPAPQTYTTPTSVTPTSTSAAPAPSTPALSTPASVAASLPQPDAKTPAVFASPSPAPAQNQPASTVSTPDTQNHPPTKLSSLETQPNPSKAEPPHPTSSPVPLPLAASTTSAPPKPIETPTPAPITRTTIPPDSPVAVPSSMMLTYVISAPKPVYPSYRHIGVDSAVNVEATISKDGKVIKARAVDGALDVRGAALQAVQEWRFRPFLLDGSPVTVVSTFRFVFKAR